MTFARPDGKLVALVAAPRSGTHFLHALLGDHPDIIFHSEVFSATHKKQERWHPSDPTAWFFQWLKTTHGFTHLSEDRVRDVAWVQSYLDDVVSQSGVQRAGIDLKYWTWDNMPKLLMAAVAHRVDLWIHLVRRDMLRAEVSELIRSVLRDRTDLPNDLQLTVTPEDDVLNAVYKRAQHIRQFRSYLAGRKCIEVVYDDLFEDPNVGGQHVLPAQQRRLLEFLGVSDPGRPLTSGRQRANPPDMGQRVANWDRLVDRTQSILMPRLEAEGLLF